MLMLVCGQVATVCEKHIRQSAGDRLSDISDVTKNMQLFDNSCRAYFIVQGFLVPEEDCQITDNAECRNDIQGAALENEQYRQAGFALFGNHGVS